MVEAAVAAAMVAPFESVDDAVARFHAERLADQELDQASCFSFPPSGPVGLIFVCLAAAWSETDFLYGDTVVNVGCGSV